MVAVVGKPGINLACNEVTKRLEGLTISNIEYLYSSKMSSRVFVI